MNDIIATLQAHGLNERQSKFVLNMLETGGNQTKSYEMAGYEPDPGHASRLAENGKVKAVYSSLLHAEKKQKYQETALSKQKIVDDLELIKLKALKNLKKEKPSSGAWNGFVKATQLQGMALGMFITKHHTHSHEHAVVSNEALIQRLQRSDPRLARAIAGHFGEVIEGETVPDATED